MQPTSGKGKRRKISCTVSKDGKVTIYPSFHETEEKGKLRRLLRRLMRLIR